MIFLQIKTWSMDHGAEQRHRSEHMGIFHNMEGTNLPVLERITEIEEGQES